MEGRRSSTFNSTSGPGQDEMNPRDSNVFSDDYAESFAESYADSTDGRSVRRAVSVESLNASQSRRQTSVESPDTQQRPLSYALSTRSRPSMIKDPRLNQIEDAEGARSRPSPRNSVLSRHGSNPTASRSMSSASSSYARASSTGQSNAGPSHPYALYPQGFGVSRSGSVASTSTYYREPPQSNAGRTPAHPYALYPQNVFSDENEVTEPSAIPVGFLQSNQRFRRRIGPEGEEQDIVGPDGHTEQLPPYTRYPQEIHTKANTGTEVPRIGETVGWEGNLQEEPRSPRRSSRSPVYAASSNNSEEAASLLSPRSNNGDSTEPSMSEKSWKEKTWKERRKTKILGLPFWAWLTLLIATMVVIGAIGGGIGAAIGRDRAEKHFAAQASTVASTSYTAVDDGMSPTQTATTTVLVDASPISQTPSMVPTLQPGTYPMRVGWSNYNTSGCLIDTDQQAAWSCALSSLAIDLNIQQNGNETSVAIRPAFPNEPLGYGSQLPSISRPHKVELVTDTEATDLGMAYQFQMLFNKLVILPGWVLSVNASSQTNQKRTSDGWISPYQRVVIDPSDEPWFCHWDKTFIEAFFYVQNPAAGSPYQTSPAPAPPPSTSSGSPAPPTPSTSPPSSYGKGKKNKNKADSGTGPNGPDQYVKRETASNSLTAPETTFEYSGDWHGMTRPPKIEERRLQSTPAGYCQQMFYSSQVETYMPKMNANNQPIIINLNEQDPKIPPIYDIEKRDEDDLNLDKRTGPPQPKGCYCQWHLLQPWYNSPPSSTSSSSSSSTATSS